MKLTVLYKKTKQKLYMKINRRRNLQITNKDLSLITNNCLGGFICHDYGLRFNSPFVNLWMMPEDFLKLCENLREYLSKDLIENKNLSEEYGYPVGDIGDLHIYFQHYNSFSFARAKWLERLTRINYEKLYIIMTLRGEKIEDSIIERFLNLRIQNKICYVNKVYEKKNNELIFIKKLSKANNLGYIWNFKSLFSMKKLYEEFDIFNWFCKRF